MSHVFKINVLHNPLFSHTVCYKYLTSLLFLLDSKDSNVVESVKLPSAVHWSMANTFVRRGMLLNKRPFSPPVESRHTSNYQLEEKKV